MRKKKGLKRLVVLPDSGLDLLRAELAEAFAALGFEVVRAAPEALEDEAGENYLPRLLDRGLDLFFSVNMQGIAKSDRSAKMCKDAGVPVVAWFVDNPWHILSAVRSPLWKSLTLAVTDHSFVAPLSMALATGGRVLHMPLAASVEAMRSGDAHEVNLGNLRSAVFVGRLSFPYRDSFFSGINIDKQHLDLAGQVQDWGGRPDFHWWLVHLGMTRQDCLWPGKRARLPGLGAVFSNARQRLRYAAALGESLTIFGGGEWGNYLGEWGDLRPSVDYYTDLPGLYRAAAFSLNLDGLLLPAGLSQRIFDVWVAGGFCLSDASPGLKLFPDELVRAISFNSPDKLISVMEYYRLNHAKKEEVAMAWREHILKEHTYVKRLEKLLAEIVPKGGKKRSKARA